MKCLKSSPQILFFNYFQRKIYKILNQTDFIPSNLKYCISEFKIRFWIVRKPNINHLNIKYKFKKNTLYFYINLWIWISSLYQFNQEYCRLILSFKTVTRQTLLARVTVYLTKDLTERIDEVKQPRLKHFVFFAYPSPFVYVCESLCSPRMHRPLPVHPYSCLPTVGPSQTV